MLNAALVDAPDDVFADPTPLIGSGRIIPLTLRLVRAIHEAGFELSSSNAAPSRINGIRRRLELEDILDTLLFAVERDTFRNTRHNDQARDRVAETLYNGLRSRRVVLRRRR